MKFVRDDVAAVWGDSVLEEAFASEGEIYRDVAGRRTLRVKLGEKHYFLKLHYGVGWGEILKNWLQFKRPVIGAENEYLACSQLKEVGIQAPLPAAFQVEAGSIASRRSFVLCDELEGFVSLEDVTDPWPDAPPDAKLKHHLLMRVADFARQFHAEGFIHRDFYICHILAEVTALQQMRADLAVLDLHRARRFAEVPERWLLRDVAALIFSALDLDFSMRDCLRFIRRYSDKPLKEELRSNGAFWTKVARRADTLYREGTRKGIVKGRYQPDTLSAAIGNAVSAAEAR